MKTFTFFILLTLFFSALNGCAQITVDSPEKLVIPGTGKFFHPKVNEAGNKILLTSENYKGLQIFIPETKELKTISESDGAGYSPVFSEDGEAVLFIETEYIQNRLFSKLNAFRTGSGKTEMINPPVRFLSAPMIAGNRLLLKSDDQLKSVRLDSAPVSSRNDLFVCIENRLILVYRDGEFHTLDPYGNESYVWPSVSPDGSRILAYAMGKGAFICDAAGKIIAEFGKVEAPVWAGNEYIVGMITEDDGHHVIGSMIVMAEVSTSEISKMTPENMTCMYPSVSVARRQIYFNNPEGEIYVLQYRTGR